MINLKKNDAIADVVRGIMEKELKGNQTKLDKNHNGKLDSQDFKILRGQKKATEDVEQIDELKKSTLASYAKKATDDVSYHSFSAGTRSSKDPERLKDDKKAMNRQAGVNKAIDRLAKEDVESVEENAFDYKSPRPIEPKGGSGVKQGSRYGGSKQKEKPEQEEPKEKMKEEIDPSDRTKDTTAGRVKTKQKDDVGPGSDGKSTKVKYHPGPMTLKGMKEKYEEPILDELISEALSKDASAGDYIRDFIHSDNPKFAGKSKAERKKMALGAYYAKKNEEYVEEGMLKNVVKKAFKALTGGSDEDQLKALQKRAGAPVTGKKPTQKEEVELDEGKEESKKDFDDRQKRLAAASAETAKDPKRLERMSKIPGYSAAMDLAKKTTKEEVVSESKGPTSQMDEPFVTDAENKPLNNAKILASKTLKRMKNEMLGKAGTSE